MNILKSWWGLALIYVGIAFVALWTGRAFGADALEAKHAGDHVILLDKPCDVKLVPDVPAHLVAGMKHGTWQVPGRIHNVCWVRADDGQHVVGITDEPMLFRIPLSMLKPLARI